MVEGCTIGAKIIRNQFFLFKNRDLRYENFQDQATFDDEIFAVTGVNIGTDELAGVSIGVNRWGLAVCSANVLITDDEPYDILLETILRKSKCIEDAYSVVSNAYQIGEAYQWCNVVLASFDGIAAIEVGPKIFDKEEHVEKLVRTNHHILLPTKEELIAASPAERECGGKYTQSEKRRQIASQLIEEIEDLDGVKRLLSTHSETKGYDSICRHRISGDKYVGETTYGYIIEVVENEDGNMNFIMHVTRSNPCINPFEKILINFDASEDEKKRVIENFP